MRIAIPGPGGIAARHAAAASALSFPVVSVCGHDPERTRAFSAEHGGEPFVDLDRMIDRVAPDLLIVALPPFVRDGEIEHAAARGVHLLIEKPIALDQGRADRITAAVAATGVVAANGFMYRFGDAVRRWRAADTGGVCLFTGAYHCNALHAPWWRDEALSGGQMLEQLIHQIDLVRHLMGEPDSVYARRANLLHGDVDGYTGEDVSAILFGWNDGRIATLTASNIATPGVWHKEWAVFAERLTGRFSGWNDAKLTPTKLEAPTEVVAGSTDVFQAQIVDVADAIRNARPPSVPLADGAATLRLALAARRSADERRELRP